MDSVPVLAFYTRFLWLFVENYLYFHGTRGILLTLHKCYPRILATTCTYLWIPLGYSVLALILYRWISSAENMEQLDLTHSPHPTIAAPNMGMDKSQKKHSA